MSKDARNREIYELWKNSHLTYRDIAEKYGISSVRVGNIVVREIKRRRAEEEAQRNPAPAGPQDEDDQW